MAAPVLTSIFPNQGDVGIPIGESILLEFTTSVNPISVKNSVVLYGADFDQTSGPDSTLWIDRDTGDNPFFLRSPGFKGLVELNARVVYYDLDTGLDLTTQPAIYTPQDELDYGVAGIAHRVYLTPSLGQLAADVEYTLHVLGDPDVKRVGVSRRTVYDPKPDVGNTGTGQVLSAGSYTGSLVDQLIVEITSSGDIGDARYKYWLASEGMGSAARDKLSNRRFREIGVELGTQIRFLGDDFAAGDRYTIHLEPVQFLAVNTVVKFTTNDGSYTVAPDAPSVPASSSPPANALPPMPGESTAGEYLQVLEMSPGDGAFNVNVNTNQIEITFSENLVGGSVNNDTVRVWRLPALGYFTGERAPMELAKKLEVNGDTLTISI